MLFFNGFPFTEPWGWFSAMIGLLITVILISVFVRIIIRIVRGDSYHYHHHHRHCDDFAGQDGTYSDARRILDERYAKGEISEEEYKRMRENLQVFWRKTSGFCHFFGFVRFALLLATLEAAQTRKMWAARAKPSCPPNSF